MDDYFNGITYATGSIITDGDKKYLLVRNIDKWYPLCIAQETGYACYCTKKKGKDQWTVKIYSASAIIGPRDVLCDKDFCRSVLEIRGVMDLALAKNRKGEHIQRLRFRIYGDVDLLQYLNRILPVSVKKTQNISTNSGRTHALYYQSRAEIIAILNWIDGSPRNENIWNSWRNIMGQF